MSEDKVVAFADVVEVQDGKKDTESATLTSKKQRPQTADRPGVEEHCAQLLESIWAGDSALHLAVVNGDLPAVKYLVSKGANVNHRASRNLYEKEFQNSVDKTGTKSKYNAYGYYGEYPLSIAAVFNHTQIYDFLIQSGADTDAQDSLGNTVLHVIVIHNQIDMFSYSMRHPWKRANPWTKNNENMTPIALCAQLGYSDMFNEIMELSRVEISKFSDLEESLYPMASFDTIGPDGVTDHCSVMMLLVFGEQPGHLEMLHHPVVMKILQEKWRVYVKSRFISRLILTTLHNFFVSLAIYTRVSSRSIGYVDYRDALRYLGECVIGFIGTPVTFFVHIEEMKTSGLVKFVRGLRNAPTKALFLFSLLLIMITVNIRFNMFFHPHAEINERLVWVEETMLIMIAPCSWVWFLFFLKTHNSFGPLIITLYTMIAKDVTKVMIIFAVFWFMFAVVFLYLWKDTEVESINQLDRSIMTVFHMSFGTFEYKYFDESKFPPIAAACFLLMMLVMPILLLNMLIATMGNTFNRVVLRSQQEWFGQYAKTVIVLERAFPKEKLAEFQKNYTRELTKDTFDCRFKKGKNRGYLQDMSSDWICAGLPLTRKVPHTRAFVHKRSLKNWKWLYGVLRTLIKAKRKHLKENRIITYWDLFGTDDILDSEYLREKMIAENLRKISLTHLFDRRFDQEDLSTIAQQALSSKAPVKVTPAKDLTKPVDRDSIEEIFNETV